MTITDDIMRLAARPEGVGTSEVPGASNVSVGDLARRLAKRGRLFIAKITRRETRFFISIEAAAAAERMHSMGAVHVKSTAVDWRNAETITPEGVKVTYGPSPPQRFTALSEFHPLLRQRAR